MFANPHLMHWVVLFFCLARLSRADYSCLCNYQVELPIFSVMDTTSTPVGYMYEFDCKPVAKVNYATDGFNVIMNEHKIAFVERSSSVLSQVCQGNIPSEDKVTALPGQNSTSSFRPIVSEATTVTTTTPTTTTTTATTTTTPVAVTTTPPTTATTTKTTTTSKLTTATTSTDTTTTPKTTTTTTTFMKLSSANAGLTLPPSTYLTRPSTTNMPTSSTTRQTTAKSNFNLAQIPDSNNISLCPPALTKGTDRRWIRQYKTFCYEIVSGRYEDWYDALQDCNNRHGDNVGGTLLEIYTADIQQFIVQFLQEENYNHPVWIGLQDVDKEESFDHWETDTVLQYQNFDPNRKDNYAPHDKEDCVLLEPSGFWDDSICTEDDAIAVAHGGHQLPYRHSYICQYPATGSQTTTTTTTTPLPSTIAPMLSNMTGNVQLCPRIVRDTTDAGYIRQYKQYCYELVTKYGDWYDANQYCRDRGTGLNGLLIEIYTADIQAFIAKILADEGYTHPVWIGLQDVDKEESFDHWESDTPLSYANFDPNRKDNYANHAQENCVLLEPSGYWDDSVCDEREANQAKQDGHPGLIYNHHWICQYL